MDKHLFVSYSHEDKMVVGEIVKRLEELDINVFLDEKSISWGDVIPETVGGALDKSIAILVVVSPDSVKSQWVAFETAYALCRKIPVLPLLTKRDIDLPPHLTQHRHLNDLSEAIDFFSSDEWKRLSAKQTRKIAEALEFGEDDSIIYAFLFLRVPAPGSGDLVSKLKEISTVVEAAAIYSEYDVIACLRGKSSRVGHSILKISRVAGVEDQRLLVVKKDAGIVFTDAHFENEDFIQAYIHIELNANVDAYSIANRIKTKSTWCKYAAPIEKSNEVLARVFSKDKKTFDELVMDKIQGTPGVTTTKSYLIIGMNDMLFSRHSESDF